ncbi:MAG: hypothetical protein KJ726_09295 [Verrucomicrobia bacterium]|nr:hypothetical protein [Verrucomicrobiota bacterium]
MMNISARIFVLLLGVTVLNGLVFAEEPRDVLLRYVTVDESARGFAPRGSFYPNFTNQPPAGDWTLPEWTGKHPLFALVSLGDQERLMVLDIAGPKSLMYDCVFFDANANLDLTDDPVIQGKARRSHGSYVNVEFPAEDVTIEHGGRSHPYRFQPSLSAYKNESRETSPAFPGYNLRASLEVQCYYAGAFSLGGKKYSLMLADSNGNGIFGDALSRCSNCWSRGRIHLMGDTLFLAEGDEPGSYDGVSFGSWWRMAGQLVSVAVDPSREKLTLTPVEGPLFPVTLSAEAERMMLIEDKEFKGITCFRPGREIQLPAGTYRFVDYRLVRKETNGALWHLQASVGTGATPVEVGADLKPEIVFGEPFRPVVEVPNWSGARRSGGSLRLNFEIYGAGGESVDEVSLLSGTSSLALAKRSSRPKEPAYIILTPEGELVDRGTFEYG